MNNHEHTCDTSVDDLDVHDMIYSKVHEVLADDTTRDNAIRQSTSTNGWLYKMVNLG